MRRLLLVAPLLIPLCAQAQTTAANPVEPFSYGVRVGTAKNPLIAALSSVVPSAQAGSTQAAMPVEMFSYGRRVGTQSNPIYVNLGNALDAYVTQTVLNTALDGYLPLTGGTINGNVTVNGAFNIKGAVSAGTSGVTLSAPLFIAHQNVLFLGSSGGVGLAVYANDSGDLLIGTGVSNGANIRGVNGLYAQSLQLSTLSGSGNAYACLNSSGQIYRSSTACN